MFKIGLVHVEFKGKKKNYVLTSEKLVLEIDLRQLLMLYEKRKDFEMKELELLAYRYFEEKIRKDKLPMTITVKDVASVLGIDTNTTIGVVDFINTYTDRFIGFIEERILEALESREEGYSIDELSKILRIHKYWPILAIQGLKSKSLVKVIDEKVRILFLCC